MNGTNPAPATMPAVPANPPVQQPAANPNAPPAGHVWVVREQPQHTPVPAGMYLAKFAGVTDLTLDGPQGGPRWRWSWQVAAGEQSGRHATALTGCDIHPASQAGVLIAGLLGRPLVPGEHVLDAIRACVGQPYLVSVQPGPKGGRPSVRSVGKPPPM